MQIRTEAQSDERAIDRLLEAAFASRSHTNHAEAAIVRALRLDGDLTLSLVAEVAGNVIGHVAFSRVTIGKGHCGLWFGLSPLAVEPAFQRQGIGSALVRRGLADLRLQSAAGCVVLGDPKFYSRFGFVSDGRLGYKGPPTRFIQRIVFDGAAPSGDISYARAFVLVAKW